MIECLAVNHQVFWKINFMVQLFVGIFSCVAFIALFGRLTSKFINLPTTVILILYIYAAIQSFYAFFNLDFINLSDSTIPISLDDLGNIVVVAKICALVGKMTFFLVIMSILKSGRLLFYILNAEYLDDNVESDIQEFGKYYGLT
jgi:hypothetical protein